MKGGPEFWINQLELMIGHLKKLGVLIDDVEIITNIIYNIPEECKKIVGKLEEQLDENNK